jgi:dimethylamine---corrinoid protein Co-methyltransferase
VGDALAMDAAHAIASGMCGMRAAGDLVARMQLTRGMRLAQAKKHVAERLKVSVTDLVDPLVMGDVRRELGLGNLVYGECCRPMEPQVMEAKCRIAEVLGVPIASVAGFTRRAGLVAEAATATASATTAAASATARAQRTEVAR